MAEKVTIGNCELWHGDCFEVLPQIGHIDAVITDPPYGVGLAEWDAEIPPLLWLDACIAKATTVAVIPGNKAMWEYPKPTWTLSIERRGSYQRAIGGGWACWDAVLVYGKWAAPKDHASVNCDVSLQSEIDHPCPKPPQMMRWIVHQILGETICDPFMGSGTTGLAAVEAGRKFVGIERERKYFDIACRRIEQAYAQPRLFEDAKVGAGETAVQGDMLLPANAELARCSSPRVRMK